MVDKDGNYILYLNLKDDELKVFACSQLFSFISAFIC